MQPRHSYTGNKPEEIRQQLQGRVRTRGWNNSLRFEDGQRSSLSGIRELELPSHPESGIKKEDIWEAYLETLHVALNNLVKISNYVDGKRVILSDRGEIIREKPHQLVEPQYDHFADFWCQDLRLVPWLKVEVGVRGDIFMSQTSHHHGIYAVGLYSRLASLGYK